MSIIICNGLIFDLVRVYAYILNFCIKSSPFTGQNYVTDSVRYRLQHQPLDVVGCGVRN